MAWALVAEVVAIGDSNVLPATIVLGPVMPKPWFRWGWEGGGGGVEGHARAYVQCERR